LFYIYVIQNKINDKLYVGKTGKPLKRFAEHINIASGSKPREHSLIHSALSKYGTDNFTFQTIEEWEDERDAYEAEKFWIEFFRSNVSKFGRDAGYNVNEGGMGAGTGSANPMFGKTHSTETIAKMSKNRTGEGNAMFGRKHTDKTKALIAEIRTNYDGEKNPRALLTNLQAQEIRTKFETKKYTTKDLGTEYNVKTKIIWKIVTNQTYRNK